jgi:hypothetical protein
LYLEIPETFCIGYQLFQHLLWSGWVLLVICWPLRLVNFIGNVSLSSPAEWLSDLQQVLILSHHVYCQVAVSTGCYKGSAVFYRKFLYLGLFRSSKFLNLSFVLHVQGNVQQETGWMI